MSRNLDYQSAVHAIKSAEASLKLARQLLSGAKPAAKSKERDLSNLSYIDGTFDGTHMTDAKGKKYEISTNYATKSMLVYGDKLRAYDDRGKYWFKQIDRVRREKSSGVLTKKSGVWHVVTSDGSYKVAPAAVDFLGLKVDDEVSVVLPAETKRVPFATLEFVPKRDRAPSAKASPSGDQKRPEEEKAASPQTKTKGQAATKKTEKHSEKKESAGSTGRKTATKKAETKKASTKKSATTRKKVSAGDEKKQRKSATPEAEKKTATSKKKEIVKEKVVLDEDDLR